MDKEKLRSSGAIEEKATLQKELSEARLALERETSNREEQILRRNSELTTLQAEFSQIEAESSRQVRRLQELHEKEKEEAARTRRILEAEINRLNSELRRSERQRLESVATVEKLSATGHNLAADATQRVHELAVRSKTIIAVIKELLCLLLVL